MKVVFTKGFETDRAVRDWPCPPRVGELVQFGPEKWATTSVRWLDEPDGVVAHVVLRALSLPRVTCPVCGRVVQNLNAHMDAKHGGVDEAEGADHG